MNILLLGSGGREHALAYKLSENNSIEKIYCVQGNEGISLEHKCECIDIKENKEIVRFAKEKDIDLTIVGPEVPLCQGIVDLFRKEGLKIFGPNKESAQLEGSKVFAKNFMRKYGVKTAEYKVFDNMEKALEYANNAPYPIVIKADGLAAGKGVVIVNSKEEAKKTIVDFMGKDVFKGAGTTIVMEEFLEGVEASILSITDGEVIIPFISSKDHKQLLDGDKGPNTGGMGVIAPNPYCTKEVLMDFKESIMNPTLKGIKKEKLDFIGVIFFGIMICKKGVYLLEYNVRMGDPETQCVLSLMDSDLVEIINAAINKKLKDQEIKWKEGNACTLVLASNGYPKEYKKGFKIEIQEPIEGKVFFAGVKKEKESLVTNGGRVLSITTTDNLLEKAIKKAYKEVNNIKFEGMYYRKDIGKLNMH
ncbi:phosphoribosylamine--glycine ligase [Hathewaya limosa]|uniref:Phosphoribosylamine--glycine ligase n=1 Tax=Hathewaya limosa TaxID=1536 RepID=A0ABU0JS18_HATLI|nr:phosphoribosylamine--glycine ligase [Hathewaya limosa]MDQ0479863.1 phosphoribosylamine--glycine ligase [Hathewaya limosa]